jgi:hypothetical protein
MDGRVVVTATGRELATRGCDVRIGELYAGELFEVSPR